MRTRARSCGSGPKQNTTIPPVLPTAWPLAKRSLKPISTSAPAFSGGVAELSRVSLVVKRLEELIRLVDQLLDAPAGRIGGLARQHCTNDGECQRRGKPCDADPYERARNVSVAIAARRLTVRSGCLVRLLHLRQSSPTPAGTHTSSLGIAPIHGATQTP